MLSFEALIGVCVSLLGGWLGERMSTKTLMLTCMGAVAIGQFALAEAHSWGLMGVFSVGVGIGYGLSFTATDRDAAEVLRQAGRTSSCSRSCA